MPSTIWIQLRKRRSARWVFHQPLKIMRCFTVLVVFVGVVFATTPLSAGDAPLASTPEKEKDEETIVLSPFEVTASPGSGYSAASTLAGTRINSTMTYTTSTAVGGVRGSLLGATVGGFKDISFGRNLLEWGLLPHTSEITIEGLFSEFDLPTPEADTGGRLLTITGDAKASAILNQPAVTHLAYRVL